MATISQSIKPRVKPRRKPVVITLTEEQKIRKLLLRPLDRRQTELLQTLMKAPPEKPTEYAQNIARRYAEMIQTGKLRVVDK